MSPTMRRLLATTAFLVVPAHAFAQVEPPPPVAPTRSPPPAPGPAPAKPTITVGAYLEEYYQLQLQDASNRITNLRGYDNRSRTFTLSNVALDVKGETGPITEHVILQIGHTPSTYYLSEPVSPGTGSVNASGSELWKYLQAANLTAKAPRDFVLEAGLFPSPIGIEVFPIKDNWNWSRSNVFFGLPAYHVGATVSHPIATGWPVKWVAEGTLTLSYQPIDNAAVRLEYRHDQAADRAYFGGDVTVDPTTQSFVPDRKSQDTITLGVTAWL
jgi:hypothetical protein